MVACIGAQEHKRGRVSGRARQGAHVADGMARGVEEVERPVAKEVSRVKAANLQRVAVLARKHHLTNHAALAVTLADDGVRVLRPPRPRGGADPWPDNQVRGGREAGRVADVVEVGVRPDDGFNVAAADVEPAAVGVEHGGDVEWSGVDGRGLSDERYDSRGVVLPVGADAQVEENVAVAVRYQVGVYGRVRAVEACDLRLQEELGVDVDECVPGADERRSGKGGSVRTCQSLGRRLWSRSWVCTVLRGTWIKLGCQSLAWWSACMLGNVL